MNNLQTEHLLSVIVSVIKSAEIEWVMNKYGSLPYKILDM